MSNVRTCPYCVTATSSNGTATTSRRRASRSASRTTDQPVGSSSKAAPFPASKPGISGLDSLLPLILKLVAEDALPLHRALDAVTAAPARCLGIQAGQLEAGRPASLCVLAADESRGLASHWLSAGRNSPWRNATLPGVVKLTVCQGKVSWLSD